jgi:hypothetical protein
LAPFSTLTNTPIINWGYLLFIQLGGCTQSFLLIKEDFIQDEENACGRTASKTSKKSKKKYRKSEEKFDP